MALGVFQLNPFQSPDNLTQIKSVIFRMYWTLRETWNKEERHYNSYHILLSGKMKSRSISQGSVLDWNWKKNLSVCISKVDLLGCGPASPILTVYQ